MTDDNVFDLDALDREANRVPFVFRFDGTEYTCPEDLSPDVLELMSEEHILEAIELLLGEDQWASIKASDKIFGVQRMAAMLDAYAAHLGVAVPNLSGSTASSARTVAPSKRTSNVSLARR